MTHRHELGQGFNIAHMEEYVWCIHCDKRWSKSEVQRIINATECLSAEDAYEAHWELQLEEELSDALFAYSRTLQGLPSEEDDEILEGEQ